MGRTPLLDDLRRLQRIARWCEREGIPTDEALERVKTGESSPERSLTRRAFLGLAGKAAAAGAAASFVRRAPAWARPMKSEPSIGIVGAGLAGLSCADELRRNGIRASLFDANDRVGGRCFSIAGVFPGQLAERGGEFIDTHHKTMLRYANEFDLELEDVVHRPGEVFYWVDGRRHTEREVIEEYRALVPAMRRDIKTTSGQPTADGHTPGDVALDNTSLREWLDTRGAGTIIAGVIEGAYIGEYGREIDEQSCLNLLFFMHADRRAKFRPFGVFGDERYHVIGGNDQVPRALGRRLADQITFGARLAAARKDSSGRVVLSFDGAAPAAFDAVVLACPFTALRDVDLSGLALPAWKRYAIENLGYGTNAKLMVGFTGPAWRGLGANGESFAHGLAHLQGTWETNPSGATATHAIMTDYTGGRLGAGLDPSDPQGEAAAFLPDLDRVFPGAAAAATRDPAGALVVDLWHWPSRPLWRGSYTCNQPGYFTTIAGNEGKPVGNVYFAGEHTNSFYEFQGFMEGAALSGIDAARRILADLKVGALA